MRARDRTFLSPTRDFESGHRVKLLPGINSEEVLNRTKQKRSGLEKQQLDAEHSGSVLATYLCTCSLCIMRELINVLTFLM